MLYEITAEEFQILSIPLIDVRSPEEYRKGHIPGSFNIPLLSDDERARVGDIYVNKSPEKATELALEYVKPKLQYFIYASFNLAPAKRVAVHCWRGGMRSHSFAEHLHSNGFTEVYIIKGGYKAFRHVVLNYFMKPFKIRIIGGYTGSGKTLILQHLIQRGQQGIDLEALACHKGSAFGDTGSKQPTTEQFENDLFYALLSLNPEEYIWLEDESRNIGGVNIPGALFNQMQNSPLYFLDIPKNERAKHLVNEYACADSNYLAVALTKLTRRLGGFNTHMALEKLKEKNYYEVALIALQYYDKSYRKGLVYRNQENIITIKLPTTETLAAMESLLKYCK